LSQDDASAETAETQKDSAGKRPSRLRAAISVLRGESLVPAQIEWEWLEYQIRFNDLLTRYIASLARGAKAEKKRIEALHSSLEEAPPQRQAAPLGGKAELRARAAVSSIHKLKIPKK